MPTNTYVALRTEVLTSAVPSVTFNLSGITGYTDLVLIITAQASASSNLQMRFNGSSAAYYSNTGMRGYSTSTADSFRQTNLSSMTLTTVEDIGNPNTNIIIQIPNYSNTTTFKTALVRANQATAGTEAIVGLWRGTTGSDTPAITSITLLPGSGNLNIGSTFTIYGISNAGDATPKATGGDVTSDATYWYHTFAMSGNFVPNQALSADVLVVAGGGGGASGRGGGGGAGGFRTAVGQSLTAIPYQVLVGGGGNGGAASGANNGTNGSNSVFSSTTSTGGGGGVMAGTPPDGLAGGSGGGGGGRDNTTPGTGGAASPAGQGNAGGNGYAQLSAARGGGGGGAGVAGTAGSSSNAGNGGNGLTNNFSGSSVIYAGGGGGGYDNRTPATQATGGTGGGGNGGNNSAGFPGLQSTGGGGGAGCLVTPVTNDFAGGNGGSGVVIIRYLKA
jgi:hypothetical protein